MFYIFSSLNNLTKMHNLLGRFSTSSCPIGCNSYRKHTVKQAVEKSREVLVFNFANAHYVTLSLHTM